MEHELVGADEAALADAGARAGVDHLAVGPEQDLLAERDRTARDLGPETRCGGRGRGRGLTSAEPPRRRKRNAARRKASSDNAKAITGNSLHAMSGDSRTDLGSDDRGRRDYSGKVSARS